jgi:hypothetical protein
MRTRPWPKGVHLRFSNSPAVEVNLAARLQDAAVTWVLIVQVMVGVL